MFHLILAMVWLFLAALFFAWPWLGLPSMRVTSSAWLCLILGSYNLVRWMSRRARRVEDKQWSPSMRSRRHHPEEPLDPNFDFSDQLFPKKSAAITRPDDRVQSESTVPEEKKPGPAVPPVNPEGIKKPDHGP